MDYFHEVQKIAGIQPGEPLSAGNRRNITDEERAEMQWADDGGNLWIRYDIEETSSTEVAEWILKSQAL